MYMGLVMECDYREGRTQEEAFAEALSLADLAEDSGLDGVWLAERHFAGPRRPTDPMGAGIPSIASVPLVLAAAIAGRTRPVARRHRRERAAAAPPHPHRRRGGHRGSGEPGPARFRCGAERVPAGVRGLRHPLRGEPRPFPGVARRHHQGLDAGTLFTRGNVLHVQGPGRRAAPLPETAPAHLDRGHHPGHIPDGRTHGPLAGHGVARLRRAAGRQTDRRLPRRAPRGRASGLRQRLPAHPGLRGPKPPAKPFPSPRRAPFGPIAGSPRTSRRPWARRAPPRERSAPSGPKGFPNVTYEELLRDRLAYGTPDMVVERLGQLQEGSVSPASWRSPTSEVASLSNR